MALAGEGEIFVPNPKPENLRVSYQRSMYDFWQSLPRVDGLPLRSDFGFIDLPRNAVPFVTLIDRVGQTDKWRATEIGAKVIAASDEDFTGVDIDQIQGTEGVFSRFTWAADNKLP